MTTEWIVSFYVPLVEDPCSFSTGFTTDSSPVGTTTDDPCTTVNTRAETTAAETITEAATIKVTTSLLATPTVPIPSTLGTTTSRAETTTTPPHDPCNPNPCRNGATCSVQGNTFTCSCVPGFSSPTCDVEINECESTPCYPFGKCTDLIGDYNCSCNPGYEPLPNNTQTCNETDFCAKETQPCFNGGTCVNQNALSRYYCHCPVLDGKQYVGLLCETELITKPIVNGGISPTSGIIAGGANVTIRGQGMNVFEPLGAYLIDTTSSPMHSLYAYVIPNLTLSDSITVRVPPAEHAYVDRNLLMIVEYTGPINVTTDKENLRFKYTGNPVIETIEPKEILVLGGVHLTVSGSNMDTVQNPMMDITTFVVNKTGNSETNYSRESCSLSSASAITCLVPHGIVPSAFFNNTTPVGKGFPGVVHLESSFRHNRGSRRRKRAPVANLTDEAGSTFEMYLGFIFDEFPTYNNISKSLPHVTLTLVSPRVNFTPGSSVDFVSNKMDTISLYGSGFTFGCSMGDYQVLVSNAPCNVTSLTDNELQCRPPKEEPPINDSSSFCVSASDPHPVKVFIGGETHLGCCLSYTTDYTDIIIAVTVSCVVVVAIIILVAVLVYKRNRKNKGADQVVRNAKHSLTDVHQPKEEAGQTPANDYDYMVPYGDGVASTFVGVNPGKQTTVVEMPLRSYPTSTRPAALARDDYLKPRDSKAVFNDYGGIGDIRGDSTARARDNYADVDDIGEISFKEHGTRPISDPEIDYPFNDNGEIDDIRGHSSGRTYDNYGHVDDVGQLSIKKHGTRPLSEPEIDY